MTPILPTLTVLALLVGISGCFRPVVWEQWSGEVIGPWIDTIKAGGITRGATAGATASGTAATIEDGDDV
jgi:hypothetical protein